MAFGSDNHCVQNSIFDLLLIDGVRTATSLDLDFAFSTYGIHREDVRTLPEIDQEGGISEVIHADGIRTGPTRDGRLHVCQVVELYGIRAASAPRLETQNM